MNVFDLVVARSLHLVPRSIVQRVSAPYIAGSSLDDARRTVASLNAEGKLATVDVLGEEVRAAPEARAIADAYLEVLAAIEGDGLDANISVKLTALGLKVDAELCRELLLEIVADAAARRSFVRIDMEDATCVDDTLALYRELRGQGSDNVGIVLQAYLRRTLDDTAGLADLRPNVRVCKGIYVEPPGIVLRDDDAIRRNVVACVERLLEGGSYVAVATHDEWVIERGLDLVAGRDPATFEWQMLLGVREQRASELVEAGHRLRVYVPFGRRWYEYSLRRLQENPRVAGMVARTTLRRLIPGRR